MFILQIRYRPAQVRASAGTATPREPDEFLLELLREPVQKLGDEAVPRSRSFLRRHRCEARKAETAAPRRDCFCLTGIVTP